MGLDKMRADLVTVEKKQTNHRQDFENTIKVRLNTYIDRIEDKLEDRDTRVKDEMRQLKITVSTLEEKFTA
jgi:gas vesicle protein